MDKAHPKCTWRGRNAYDAEFGCPLDHCGYCGGHDDGESKCERQRSSEHHEAWTQKCLAELFEIWLSRQTSVLVKGEIVGSEVRDLLWRAFMFGVEGKDHEMHPYNMASCGLMSCKACHGDQFEDEPDPMGSPEDYR